MTLKGKVVEDIKVAMKSKDQVALGALRMAKARFMEFETSGKGEELTDEKAIGIIQNLIKQRRESAKLYEENSRQELADKEKQEIAVLEKYLPNAIGEDVVQSTVNDVVSQLGDVGPKNMGQVMGAVMGKLKQMDGLVDGALVQRTVKEALNKAGS